MHSSIVFSILVANKCLIYLMAKMTICRLAINHTVFFTTFLRTSCIFDAWLKIFV